jgi:hypothetical protein
MAKAKDQGSAMAVSEESPAGGASALMARGGGDALASVLGDIDVGTTGLEEADASDRRLSALVWNMNATDADGEPIPKNAFFDTVAETTSKKKRLTVLTLHKSNAYQVFVDGQGTVTKCRSWDRVTGEMEDGGTRPCHRCPDKEWRRDPSTGKRTRACADVANVVALDWEDGQPKALRFKKTSMRPWQDFLNKHFLGKRLLPNGTRADVPLFAFEVEVSLEMVKGNSGSYATPVFELGRGGAPYSRDEILYLAEESKAARSYLDDVRKVVEKADAHDASDASEGGSGGGTVIDAEDFSDDAPPVGAGMSGGAGAAQRTF